MNKTGGFSKSKYNSSRDNSVVASYSTSCGKPASEATDSSVFDDISTTSETTYDISSIGETKIDEFSLLINQLLAKLLIEKPLLSSQESFFVQSNKCIGASNTRMDSADIGSVSLVNKLGYSANLLNNIKEIAVDRKTDLTILFSVSEKITSKLLNLPVFGCCSELPCYCYNSTGKRILSSVFLFSIVSVKKCEYLPLVSISIKLHNSKLGDLTNSDLSIFLKEIFYVISKKALILLDDNSDLCPLYIIDTRYPNRYKLINTVLKKSANYDDGCLINSNLFLNYPEMVQKSLKQHEHDYALRPLVIN